MRDSISLPTDWWVSVSSVDAELAARSGGFEVGELQLADDSENHPQLIELPGGPQYGKRPLHAEAQRTDAAPADTAFVGPTAEEESKRLPAPFLSYAQAVAIPAEWAGQTIFLTLDMTRYHVTVHVNGTQVAQYVGGLEPHRIDVTAQVTPGQEALLLITVGDSGVSGKQTFDPYCYTGTRLPTCQEIENCLVHPVNYGGADRGVGSVTLEAVPAVRTEYVFANPKVAAEVLQYTAVLANDTDQPAEVHIFSEAVEGKVLLDEDVTIPPQGTAKVYREVPWEGTRLWDLDDPWLYQLRTVLTPTPHRRAAGATGEGGLESPPHAEEIVDLHEDCFGFREFTIDGPHFYLNGKKIHLHGNSGHVAPPQHNLSLEEKMEFLRVWKEEGHIVHVRLHARPQDKRWVEAADRVGVLITTETALWTTGFHSFDWAGQEEACSENVSNHFLEALVRRDRNNPSVVIWSLSNEMSPITPADLENPKMAALTRAFERIIAATEAEDDSRIIQMSSAMDFLGKLPMYNLHYPKSWAAYPDFPHTAYWLDSSFLFPWYGSHRHEMPSWSWRRDKPLIFGEFTCVYGATPDSQASIVGDAAFEDRDFGSARVDEKLWPLEVKSYRRLDVSGFCAWSFVLGHETDPHKSLAAPHVAAHTEAVRPLAALDHSYRSQYFAGDEITVEMSMHNDTREARELALRCDVLREGEVIWTDLMPPAVYEPGEVRAFTNRCRTPETDAPLELTYRVEMTSGGQTVDAWERVWGVWPRTYAPEFPSGCAFHDPDGAWAERLEARGIEGATTLHCRPTEEVLAGFGVLWLNFAEAKVNNADWREMSKAVREFVQGGGCVVLDQPTEEVLADLPVPLANGPGNAEGERLEITYAYNVAPHHPLGEGLSDEDFALWGEDYYVARRCFETPQEGNVLPLLVAGTSRTGLTSSPLLEVRDGKGSWLVSSLDLFGKLVQAPRVADIVQRMAAYEARQPLAEASVAVGDRSMQRLREVGYTGEIVSAQEALGAQVALVDGECVTAETVAALGGALEAGRTVCLHDLTVEQTREVLRALELPGEVEPGAAGRREYDVFRHTRPLADGMTNNYLYWIVDKAKVAPWTQAPLHPEPASALIRVSESEAAQITRRGAVTIYQVGAGTLVIDNLAWHDARIEEPERPRRYLTCLLTSLGVPLAAGAEKRMSEDYETLEERREKGHM